MANDRDGRRPAGGFIGRGDWTGRGGRREEDRPREERRGTEWTFDPDRPDPAQDYRAWREYQLRQLDHDYEAYRRERAERLDAEFDLRQREKRQILSRIRRGMEVFDSLGTRMGVVDKVEGRHFKIMRYEEGRPLQCVSPAWVAAVDGAVYLNKSRDEARRLWEVDEWRFRRR